MLRRMLMALLIACLAAPALAMPAHVMPPALDGMSGHHAMHHHSRPHEAPAGEMRSHECIGCIAPAAPLPLVATPIIAGRPLLGSGIAPFRALAPPAPETPPPRA